LCYCCSNSTTVHNKISREDCHRAEWVFCELYLDDVGRVRFGLRRDAYDLIEPVLVSLEVGFGSSPVQVPPAYSGRVSGNIFSGQANFTISSITKQDENVYGCEIELRGVIPRTRVDFVQLAVEETPVITYLTAVNSSYREGSAVNISCKAKGKPDPEVRWIHNEEVKSFGSKTAHLTFSSISKADKGIYTCRANNSAGIIEKRLKLVVNCEY